MILQSSRKNTWEKYLTKEGVSYTNRFRYENFKRLFKKYKFKVINQEIKRFPVKIKKINKEFQNRKNLDIGILRMILQR